MASELPGAVPLFELNIAIVCGSLTELPRFYDWKQPKKPALKPDGPIPLSVTCRFELEYTITTESGKTHMDYIQCACYGGPARYLRRAGVRPEDYLLVRGEFRSRRLRKIDGTQRRQTYIHTNFVQLIEAPSMKANRKFITIEREIYDQLIAVANQNGGIDLSNVPEDLANQADREILEETDPRNLFHEPNPERSHPGDDGHPNPGAHSR